ncbi:MAG: hypothetical protein L6R48_10990 [Planctomycetes bacterium]|nr:hypothetical protein [Planctomycetota bacterium]
MLTRLLFCWGLALGALAAAEPALLLVPPDVLADYRRWLHDRDVLTVDAWGGDGARRDVVEVALAQQALARGGWSAGVAFQQVDSYPRQLAFLDQGRAVMTATTVWRDDLAELAATVAGSPTTIPPGAFVAGLYTTPGNDRALRAGADDLGRLTAVCHPAWLPDWRALERLHMAALLPATSWEAMVEVVSSQRADVLLAPFQGTPGLALRAGERVLVPIPGLAVELRGERCFALARSHPQGAAIAAAIERGVRALEAAGTLRAAYTGCGFINPAVADWKRL